MPVGFVPGSSAAAVSSPVRSATGRSANGGLARSTIPRLGFGALDRLRLILLSLALAATGCTPHIGDTCLLSTDCSLQGTVLCDTSQPNGYCTVFNCTANQCPNNAACVLFNAAIAGCAYNDRTSPSRTSLPFCMAQCSSDSDCRQSDGYVCADPRKPPWDGLVARQRPVEARVHSSADLAERQHAASPRRTPKPRYARLPGRRCRRSTRRLPSRPIAGREDAGRGRRRDRRRARPAAEGGPSSSSRDSLEALAVLFVLASLVFFALRLLPGDPARLVLGDEASPPELARVRARSTSTSPSRRSTGASCGGLATLDLGDSLRRPGARAMARVGEALGPTAELAGVAVLLGALMGVAARRCSPRGRGSARAAAGSSAASSPSPRRRSSPSRRVVTYALAARAAPRPSPGRPRRGLRRAPLRERAPRRSARGARGAHRARFAGRGGAGAVPHGRDREGRPARARLARARLAGGVGPIVTVVATQLGALLGGAVVLERLFERGGLGTLILEAYASRDLPGARRRGRGGGRPLRRGAGARAGRPRVRSTRARGPRRDDRYSAPGRPSARAPAPSPFGERDRLRRSRASRIASSPRLRGARRARRARSAAARRGSISSLVSGRGAPRHRARRRRRPRRLRDRDAARRGGGARARPRRARVVARACDLVQAFPTFLLALAVLSAVRSPTRVHIGFVFALTAWAPFARLALAQTRVLREAAFVEAAVALGARRTDVLARHVVPNLLGVVGVQLGSTARPSW